MLKNINILYDRDGFLGSLKKRLSEYPDRLFEKLVKYHLDELKDKEDLERTVMRKDVLFYHFALDIAIDHFLQALFVINRVFFPSRKRTPDFIREFDIKPDKCCEWLLEVVKLGGCAESVARSYELWCDLVREVERLYGVRV